MFLSWAIRSSRAHSWDQREAWSFYSPGCPYSALPCPHAFANALHFAWEILSFYSYFEDCSLWNSKSGFQIMYVLIPRPQWYDGLPPPGLCTVIWHSWYLWVGQSQTHKPLTKKKSFLVAERQTIDLKHRTKFTCSCLLEAGEATCQGLKAAFRSWESTQVDIQQRNQGLRLTTPSDSVLPANLKVNYSLNLAGKNPIG